MGLGLVIGAMFAVAFVMLIGGGIGYWLWNKSKPKPQSWVARIWQKGDGIRKINLTDNSHLDLNDLKAYGLDTLEKIDVDVGIIRYELKKMKRCTPSVEGDFVDVFGNVQEVNLLYDKGGITFLKKGYDKIRGEAIFTPVAQDTINIVKQEITSRQEKIKKNKDILEAISPWIIAGIMMMGLVAFSYITISGFIKISEEHTQSIVIQEQILDKTIQHENKIMEWRYGVLTPSPSEVGYQRGNSTLLINEG